MSENALNGDNVDGQQNGQQLVTKAEYARLKGWDRSYLSKKETVKKIRPALVKNAAGKTRVDVKLADEIFSNDTDPSKVRKATKNTPHEAGAVTNEDDAARGFYDTKAEREQIRLEQEKLNLAERKGLLLPRAETIRAISAVGMIFRDGLKARTRHLAQQLSTMKDTKEIAAFLEKQDQALLETISHELKRRIPIEEQEDRHPTVN